MAKIKTLEKIAKKWDDRVGVASDDYIDGIKNPTKDWEDNTLAGKANYEAGIQAAIRDGRREKGVAEAGTKKWQDKSVEKSGRWASGVTVAKDDMKKGYAPYHDVIQGIDYGVRYPPGDPRNLKRVQIGNDALHAKKVELKKL